MPVPRSRGFTAIELTTVIAIVGLLAVFAADFMRSVIVLDGETRGILLAQDDARRAFKQMVTDIRLTNYADNGAYPIVQADATDYVFYANVNSDGKAERVRYFLSGTSLKRGVILPTGAPPVYDPASEAVATIATDLDNGAVPVFDYYDSSYDGTTAPLPAPVSISAVRLVKITVVINKNAVRAPTDQAFSTQVSLRNLKDNL